ncbi:unnamed protein product, partial [marine sediment metagenome]
FAIPFAYIVSLVSVFVSGVIIFLWAKIFGGKATIEQSIKMYMYAQTPHLFSWIPFVGGLASIWALLLLIIGTQKVHKMSRLRAALIYLIPSLILVVFIIAIILLIVILISANPELILDKLAEAAAAKQ